MFSSLLTACGKSLYPCANALIVANQFISLPGQPIPYNELKEGPVISEWQNFVSKFPNGKTVKLFHGYLPTNAMAIGSMLFKNTPKNIALDMGLEYLDPQGAMWFCKHEFAHINHSEGVKQHSASFVANILGSYYTKSWYSPLILGYIIHVIADNTIGLNAECNADNFAIEYGTEEELKGALRFFEAYIQVYNEKVPPNTLLNKLSRLVLKIFDRHPSNEDRQNKVERCLRSRFNYTQIQLDEIKKDEKIQKYKEYLLFRVKTPVSDPDYGDKVMKLFERLGVI
jgi:hypothetical protein